MKRITLIGLVSAWSLFDTGCTYRKEIVARPVAVPFTSTVTETQVTRSYPVASATVEETRITRRPGTTTTTRTWHY